MADFVKEGFVGVQVEDDFDLNPIDASGNKTTVCREIEGVPVKGDIYIGRTVKVGGKLMKIEFRDGDFGFSPYDAADFDDLEIFQES